MTHAQRHTHSRECHTDTAVTHDTRALSTCPGPPLTARRPNGGASDPATTAEPGAAFRAPHRSRGSPTVGTRGGASFAEGDARSPPAQTRKRFRAGGRPSRLFGAGSMGSIPPARPPRKSREGEGPSNRSRGDPCNGLPILGEVLVTMHQTPASRVTIRWTDDRTERERLLPLHERGRTALLGGTP